MVSYFNSRQPLILILVRHSERISVLGVQPKPFEKIATFKVRVLAQLIMQYLKKYSRSFTTRRGLV